MAVSAIEVTARVYGFGVATAVGAMLINLGAPERVWRAAIRLLIFIRLTAAGQHSWYWMARTNR